MHIIQRFLWLTNPVMPRATTLQTLGIGILVDIVLVVQVGLRKSCCSFLTNKGQDSRSISLLINHISRVCLILTPVLIRSIRQIHLRHQEICTWILTIILVTDYLILIYDRLIWLRVLPLRF